MKKLSPRDLRIREKNIRKVAAPWSIDKDDLDKLCSEGMIWTSSYSYNQLAFYKFVIIKRCYNFIQEGLIDEEGYKKIFSMLNSYDKELSKLAQTMLISLLKQFKDVIQEKKNTL